MRNAQLHKTLAQTPRAQPSVRGPAPAAPTPALLPHPAPPPRPTPPAQVMVSRGNIHEAIEYVKQIEREVQQAMVIE